MGMDALTSAAFQSLSKEILPKLTKYLESVANLLPAQRQPNPEISALLIETQELLGLMSNWFATGSDPTATTDLLEQDMSDNDALSLLGSEGVKEMAGISLSGKRSVAESLADDEEFSDEDAMAMAMMMDEPDAPAQSSGELSDEEAMAMMMAEATDNNALAEPTGEMSDAEAMQLLAYMDAPPPAEVAGEMSDAEAMQLLADMDSPAEVTNVGMSDEEALKLLAAMDAPPPATSAEEMSDDEARRFLREMDAPAARPTVMSADDEAMALLAQMGGADLSEFEPNEPVVKSASTSVTLAPLENVLSDSGEQLAEISEFSQNDFSSDPEMMSDFLSNTGDLMETLDATVLQLEQNPKDKETIESIFRAAHTLKGAAGMFGFKSMERVMHRMEGLFDQVRKGLLVPDANTIDVVFQGLDVLKKLLLAVESGKPSGAKTVPIVKALELAATGKYVKTASPQKTSAAPPPTAGNEGENHGLADKPGATTKKVPEQSTIKVDLERLDTLVNLVGELVIDRTRFISIDDEIRQSHPQLKVTGNMSETVQLFGRHMNEIHDLVMKIRMVPIGNTFTKFTRIVRDLSRQLGKEIELYLDGEDTELDKTLVEQIGDPLIHLIRNSCDHGVELPAAREAAGKRRGGKIFLSARQEGNHIIITIEDDGKGINAEIIRKKAIEKGMIPEDSQLTDRDTFNLIFEPGFSTAEQITNVSGRGVGMDVVKKQISKLKGLIDISSEVGRGTTITIRLPLTLAIMQSLLVESAGEAFAIPLSAVVESVRISPNEIQNVGDAEVIKRHGNVLPLMYLSEVLKLRSKNDDSWYSNSSRNMVQGKPVAQQRVAKKTDKLFVVIVGSSENRYGIVVDQLLNQQEMVIKSLGPIMKNTACVAGGAVQGNGEVVLVLDIQEVMDEFRNQNRRKVA